METTKTQFTRMGLTQARNHPRTALRVGAIIGRHPRRAWKAVALVRYAQNAVTVGREVALARHREQARARRRARIRGVAIGMSVIGAGTVAGLRFAQSRSD